MEGGIGNDSYSGSLYEEFIIYESGIDTINLETSGLNDSLNCPSGFTALRSGTIDITLFYNTFNQIIIRGGYNINYTLKNVCGRSLLSIIDEAYINSLPKPNP